MAQDLRRCGRFRICWGHRGGGAGRHPGRDEMGGFAGRWCGQEDSNFHGVTPTSTSSLRVYHSAMTAPWPAEAGV
jgi:hypothetical protein